MKIFFVIKGMDTAKGGAERVLAQISSGISERGHDVTLVTCDAEGGESYYPLNADINRVCLNIPDDPANNKIQRMKERIRPLRHIFKTEKPDLVIAFMHSMFIPASFAAFGTGIPVIASEHIVPAHYIKRPAQYMMLLVSSFLVKRITVVSKAVLQSYPFFMRHKMLVVANPVAEATANSKKPNSKQKIILNIGRLDEQKDQKTLIRAFAYLADRHPDWVVKIFGEGPLDEYLQKLIGQLGMEGRVRLMGTTKDVGSEYAKADIFAMPSKYESFGLATAEAMSYGVPAIGFKECPGTNELIEHDFNGLLISKTDQDRVEVFAQGLEKLITDEALRERLASETKASVDRFKLGSILAVWDSLIQSTGETSQKA